MRPPRRRCRPRLFLAETIALNDRQWEVFTRALQRRMAKTLADANEILHDDMTTRLEKTERCHELRSFSPL
jgi:hypothetical protein